MSRLTLLQGLLLNFKGEIGPRSRAYLTKKDAYEQLKKHTGQDFGEDMNAWEQWIAVHPQSIKAKDLSPDYARKVSDFMNG